MHILDEIVRRKTEELKRILQERPFSELIDQLGDEAVPSLAGVLDGDALNVIAEIKYRSPSHGPFVCQRPASEIAREYVDAGAAAISILTDSYYFGGSLEFLKAVRSSMKRGEGSSGEDESIPEIPPRPLLRKDFLIDRYQVAEARLYGASAFLLIAACLDTGKISELRKYGEELGLEALVEVHDPFELESAVEAGSVIIGVNNRNLNTFDVDIRTSFEIARRLEGEKKYLLVAESGLSSRSQLVELKDAGFSGFLIGTTFMDSEAPGERLAEMLEA